MRASAKKKPFWHQALSLLTAIVLAVGLAPLPLGGVAYADDLVAAGSGLAAQDVSQIYMSRGDDVEEFQPAEGGTFVWLAMDGSYVVDDLIEEVSADDFQVQMKAAADTDWSNVDGIELTITANPYDAGCVDIVASIPDNTDTYDKSWRVIYKHTDVGTQIPSCESIHITQLAAEVEATELAITNNINMFKAVTASAIENADGSATLVMALSGTGYHYLYKGTYEDAVANGTAIENWIAGAVNAEGKWEFRIPIAADELGTNVPVVAVSQSYYEKYQNGQNSIERSFFPRQVNLNLAAATLVADDYASSQALEFTNNAKTVKVSEATLGTVGGPNSNGYKKVLSLSMSSDSYGKVFVGTSEEAGAATDGIVELSEGEVFAIELLSMKTPGNPSSIVSKWVDGQPFALSFMPAAGNGWVECTAVLDEAAGTLALDQQIDSIPIPVPKAKAGLAYTGAAQVGVAPGEGYALTGTTKATTAGTYAATAKLDPGYVWADGTYDDKQIGWSIAKADIAKAKVTLKKAGGVYNGKAQKGAVKSVALGKKALKAADYSVSAKSGKKAGSYTVTVTGKGNYKGKATATYKVTKAAAKAAVTKAKAFKVAQLKKAAASFVAVKLTTDGKAAWKVTKNSNKKYVAFSAGKVTVKKGAPKGKYTLAVKVSAKAGTNYKALAAKAYTITVTVK